MKSETGCLGESLAIGFLADILFSEKVKREEGGNDSRKG